MLISASTTLGHASSPSRPRAVFFTGTALTFLKPRFKRVLRPVASRLAHAGVTANQVTLASLVGSIAVGAALCTFSNYAPIFAILPVWLLIRMACATIDGTLAIEFGQKSRLGGVLNEVGDLISEAALLAPLAFVAPLSAHLVVPIVVLILLTEIVGMLGVFLGSDRRLDGPLGKADRSIILAIIAVAIAIFGDLPGGEHVMVAIALTSTLTIWNRLRISLTERGTENIAR